MASSLYFSNGDPEYWPYQTTANISSGNSSQPTSTYVQEPHQYQTPQQRAMNYDAGGTSPNSNLSPPASLLETLLRHGKEAIGDKYTNFIGGKTNSGQPTSTHIPSQTPPYTPSSSSNENSPLSVPMMESPTQGRFQQHEKVAAVNYDRAHHGYAHPTRNSTSCITTVAASALPTTVFEATHRRYTSPRNNNDEDANSTEVTEYTHQQSPRPVNYPWMKSNSAGKLLIYSSKVH